MPINALCNTVEAQLIYEGFKYVVKVAKMGPTSYFVVLNNSYVTVEAHRYLVSFVLKKYLCATNHRGQNVMATSTCGREPTEIQHVGKRLLGLCSKIGSLAWVGGGGTPNDQ